MSPIPRFHFEIYFCIDLLQTCDHSLLSFCLKKQVKIKIDSLQDESIIEEYERTWAAPVVLVPKKDGGVRLCVDYRRLNVITVSDSYSLPPIEKPLEELKRPYI